MGLFRRRQTASLESVPTNTVPQKADGYQIDLVRFDLLLQTSQKLHDAGVDYDAIEERAEADAISFNEALEAIYAERFRG
jgi:hypothetical protein